LNKIFDLIVLHLDQHVLKLYKMQQLQQLLLFLFFSFIINFSSATAQCNNPEYDLLATIYNESNGPNWRFNDWDFSTCNICEWQGVWCNSDSRVIGIALYSQTSFTVLPEEFGGFEFLEELYLRDNDIVSVPITVLKNFNNLKYLDLSSNLFTEFPDSMGCLTNLEWLNLAFNEFNEAIPPDFGLLENLETLKLRKSKISGPIPIEMANMTSLKILDLSENELTSFPNTLCQIESLENLDLSVNELNDFIPVEIGNLINLKELKLLHSGVRGEIPPEIGNLISLELLNIRGSNLSGTIPTEIGNLQELEKLNLSQNFLSSQIPKEVFLPHLTDLDLSYNLFSETIPVEFGNSPLHHLYLNNNYLEGNIPTSIGELTKITNIDLSSNRLEGPIPPEIGELGSDGCSMEDINLSNNYLSGTIPIEFGNICFDGNDYAYLRLSFNELTGSIPIELFTPFLVPHLDIFINNNNLSGCYDINLKGVPYNPCWFYRNEWISEGNNFDADWEDYCETGAGSCEQLPCAVLDYAWLVSMYDNLNGPNWTQSWDLSDCNICNWYGITCDENNRVTEIDLADNNLSGSIPSNIYLLDELKNLYLQNNNISGEFPAEFAKSNSIEIIHLQNNSLESMGEFRAYFGLEELRLNDNQLAGNIPSRFIGATEVLTLQNNMLEGELSRFFKVASIFNISNNQLSGTIESLNFTFDPIIDTFDISSNQFEGCYDADFRAELCGFSNEVVSDGNQFDAEWEDFCLCQAGICQTNSSNFWIAEEGNWDNPQNWSGGHVPLKNETVKILYKYFHSAEPCIVHVPENYEIEIFSLDVQGGAELIIPQTSIIHVTTGGAFQSLVNCDE